MDILRDPSAPDALKALFLTGRELPPIMSQPPPGWPLYVVLEVPPEAEAAPSLNPTPAVFGGAVRLLGYAVAPGEANRTRP